MGPVPETFESVIREAQNAQKEMNNRKRFGGGKPKDYYNKFCQNAYQHRTVFDIFPSSNEYTEIFCGSINTLVKVQDISNIWKALGLLTSTGLCQLYSDF